MSGTYSREDIDQLFQAASDGNLTVISECINWKNIPVDITNESGLTPLMEASRYGRKEAVETLIKTHKCSINAQDKHGFTALHWAIQIVYHSVIDILLQCGASLTIKNKNGHTAGEMAESQGKKFILGRIKDVEKEQNRIRRGYLKALRFGSVLVQLVTVLLVGPPGVGKSSLAHNLVGKMLPYRRRSSGSVSFSPRMEADHSSKKPITWTELSFDEVLSRTANMIAPIVAANISADPMKHPQSSRRHKFVKYLGKKFKRLPQRLSKATLSSSSTCSISSMKTLSASLDDLIVVDIVSNSTPPNEDRMKTFITIMDSGGQKAFLNLYPIFVRNPSLVTIVFKMTNDRDCIWKPQPKDEFYTSEAIFTDLHQINHSAADLIKHTMANISTYADYTNNGAVTHICCVGTHKDQVSAAAITEIDKQLTDLVKESGYASLVITRSGRSTYTKLKTLFPVNNLVAGHPGLLDEVVQELIEIPLKFLTEGKTNNTLHEIPIRWMNLELQIRDQCQLHSRKYISYTEALDIALKNHQFEDEEEFLNMLQYFHNLSLLLYYHNIPYLKDMIIIDNNLVIETVSKLVEFTFTGNGIPTCDFNNFKYCGVFSEALLSHPDLTGKLDPQGLVQLLVSLNIASPLPDRLYFMPCVLPNIEEFTESSDDFLNTHYGAKLLTSIAIQFSSGLFPRGVFCSLVVCLMNSERTATRWTLCRSSSPSHKEVFSNLATFTLPSGHRVSIHDKMSHCEIQINHNNHKTATITHYDVLSTLLHLLQDVCTTMSLSADFHVGFQCVSEECAHSNNHFALSEVSLPLNKIEGYSICRSSGNPTKLTEDQEVWLKSPDGTDGPNREIVQMDPYFKRIHKILSNHTCGVKTKADLSELLTYSNSWSTEWESIGIKLGLSPLKLKEIFMDRRLVTDCCLFMLLEWTRSTPNACYCKLVTALYELTLKEAAYKVAKDKLTAPHN